MWGFPDEGFQTGVAPFVDDSGTFQTVVKQQVFTLSRRRWDVLVSIRRIM